MKPPSTLSRASKSLFRSVIDSYGLEKHHLRLLILLCEALDRATDAQAIIAAEGLTLQDRFGQTRTHPAVTIRRDAEISAARLLRELDLDGEPLPSPRPPGLGRNR